MSIQEQYPTICVYAGSADGLAEGFMAGAFHLGQVLAQTGIRLVYGAGKTGLMGAVADGVLQNGGEVMGVIPESLNQPQLLHAGLTSLEVVPTIHARKARMSALASAFIALPGGYGTYEELFETLAWAQIGLHRKPVGLLNLCNYYAPILELIRYTCESGFIYPEHRQLILSAEQPESLLEQFAAYAPPDGLERWISREESPAE